MRQIIINLVGNAIKFTPEGSVALLLTAGQAQDGQVPLSISVTDTGIGVAEDKIQRIFESFEQADNSTKRSFGGTGLGLAITRLLVEAMGGAISATSQEGKGSTFTVTLRLAAHDPASDSTENETSGLRDLLSEADEATRSNTGTKAA